MMMAPQMTTMVVNSNVDPPCCCGCTARTWNIVNLSIKVIASIGLVLVAGLILGHTEGAVDNHQLTPEIKAQMEKLKPAAKGLMGFAVGTLIFYIIMICGVCNENYCLVTTWVVLCALELVCSLISVIYAYTQMAAVLSTAPIIISVILYIGYDMLCLGFASAHRNRVRTRQYGQHAGCC